MTMRLPSRSEGSKERSKPFEFAFGGELADFRARLGGDDAKAQTSFQQAADFVEGYRACTDQQGRAAFEFEEDG